MRACPCAPRRAARIREYREKSERVLAPASHSRDLAVTMSTAPCGRREGSLPFGYPRPNREPRQERARAALSISSRRLQIETTAAQPKSGAESRLCAIVADARSVFHI